MGGLNKLIHQSIQDCSTHAFTRFSYSRRFSLYSWAAIELAGLLGLGSLRSDLKEKKQQDAININPEKPFQIYSINTLLNEIKFWIVNTPNKKKGK